MAGIADQFAGLPIEDLIVQPLVGMAKGQAQLNDVTWAYINQVAFREPTDAEIQADAALPDGQKKGYVKGKKITNSIDVQLNRYVTEMVDTGVQDKDGQQIFEPTLKLQQINSMVPMLPLVPLPSLAITAADIKFTMEVKTSEATKSSVDKSFESSASASGGFWGMKYSVSMTGKVASHSENTRSSDQSAKYDVSVHAEQLPATEGMSKLSDMLNMMMDPAVVAAK